MFVAPRSRFAHHAGRVIAVLGLIFASLWTGSVGCLWVNESRLVFATHRTRLVAPFAEADLISLDAGDGVRLDAVALEADLPTDYWVLFCLPSGGTIHGRFQSQLYALRSLGYNVFSFDYRGFGRGRRFGTPTEAALYEDAATAYRYLTERRGVPASRIILAGRSLGSAVAVELATRVPAAGLLLLSALDSVPDAAGRLYPWAPVSLLASYRFDSVEKAARVRAPVVQVHSAADWLIPLDAARALFQRFPQPKLLVESRGGHNRAGIGDPEVAAALAKFWPLPDPADEEE